MGRALRNAPPTKREAQRHAEAVDIGWDLVRADHDWAAISVALDVVEQEGTKRSGRARIAEASRYLPTGVFFAKRTNEHYLARNNDVPMGALVLTDLPPKKENFIAVFHPRTRTLFRVAMSPYGDRRWHIIGGGGDWSTVDFATAEEAKAMVPRIDGIDRDGLIWLKKGEPVGDLRVRERQNLLQSIASYKKIGASLADQGAIARALERFDELLTDERFNPHPATPNRSRVKVYDAAGVAKEMRETFTNRPVERVERLPIGWPPVMQAIGDSLGVAYGSDKWKDKDHRGRREVELYKHLSESRNRILARPGVLHDQDDPQARWPVIGPKVRLTEVPMPSDFAVLGLFEGLDLKLHTEGTSAHPRFGRGDAGIVHVRVGHGYVGGSKIRWSQIDPSREDEVFLFVYTKDGGVMFVVIGDELDIEKDGIVG